ncbi:MULTISPECIES: murein biosynthesis integral membrane protein MurJ [unclassified Isoptericola]|uniref:murein biosynthesis integral membrane protein MurJ n=1 Tax=unclassified Isoptericola TaxID=2623355 RepID=UPI0027135185|nr:MULTISPECIES: lipid II flippase MurJ [unclassified Isoptericola]MDO8143770.1 lipid II flippase MurJ [Isoptericola sp. 178]MDO8147671.1 lipid II flippase MurJ [Isoptericola sp. b515]MDO8150029.1 lipid II flippase MurJ [Isoptericola sp. b408]
MTTDPPEQGAPDATPAGPDDASGRTADPHGVRRASLGKGSLAMSLGTAASRASGLVRTMLLVGAVGAVGTVANAFDIANKLPNMLFALISAGFLQSVLVPQIMKAMSARNARERLDKLLTISGLGLLSGTIVLVAAAPLVVHLMTLSDAWTPEARQLAVVFAYWCLPQLFFYGLYTLLGQVLSAHGRFAAYGWAPVANNVVSIVGFGTFILLFGQAPDAGLDDVGAWTTVQTLVLAGTATLGIAAQSAILVPALRKAGFRWGFRLGLRGIGLRSAGKVVGWTIGAVVLEQLGVIYLTNVTGAAGQLAEDLGEVAGGPAAYTQAMSIYLLPHSLVVVSIVTVLFPRMSAAVNAGDLPGVRRDMSLGLRSAGIFSVFSATALLVLAFPLTKALLPSASELEVEAIAPILRAMAVGTIALGATVLVRRMYFAFEDGRSIFVIQIIATVSLVAGLWIATETLPYTAWAAAAGGSFALATWISLLLRIRGMNRKLHGMDGARVLRLYVRALLSAAVAGGFGWLTIRLLDASASSSWGFAVLTTAVAGLVMGAAYAGLLKLMRVRELDDALAPILRRLRRGPA